MPYQIALGKESEPLVADLRVERVFWHLQRLTDFAEGTEFATFIQEPSAREPRRLAVFMVLSEHPRKDPRALTVPKIITATAMTYDQWKEQDKTYRHYANLTDPIRPIFAGVLRRHLAHLKSLNEFIENEVK
jgi:hypothetical protein